MAILWSKLYKHRPDKEVDDAKRTSDFEITEQARFLGHRYMTRKMRRSALTMGTASLKQVKSFQHRTEEHTTLIICQLIETLEYLHPETYGNISANMLISNFNERPLCQDFATFAEELFQNGVKWPLILAFYAFCGALAEECTRHGCSRTLLSILNWIHCFTALRLSLWIKEQGGWNGLVEHFKSSSLKECESYPQNAMQTYKSLTSKLPEIPSMESLKSLGSLKSLTNKETALRIGMILLVFTILFFLFIFLKSFMYSRNGKSTEL